MKWLLLKIRPQFDLDEEIAAEDAIMLPVDRVEDVAAKASEDARLPLVEPVQDVADQSYVNMDPIRASLHEEVTAESPVIVRPPPVDIWTSSEARNLFNMQTGKFTSNPS